MQGPQVFKTESGKLIVQGKSRKSQPAVRSNASVRRGRTAHEVQNAAGSWSPLVAEARRYLGTKPTSRRTLWCAAFMNLVLKRTGHPGSGSDMAKSFASYGMRLPGPQVGAIAVMSRGRGGHVGVVSGVSDNGDPIVISGNFNDRVAEAVYPRGSVIAYVMPNQ